MKTKFLVLLLLLSCSIAMFPQTQFNANTKAGVYKGNFLFGSNMEWLNNSWSDADIADLVTGNPEKGRVGTGTKSLRPALYEYFVEKYGYENRVPFFEHYKSMGVRTNVIFIGDRPSEDHRENAYYCKDSQGNTMKEDDKGYSLKSKLYKNLYEPIWVEKNGAKVVNENNYYAIYVYKLAKIYSKYTSFYEIMNEPDFTYMGLGDKKHGEKDNWWENDPKPQSLYNVYAPVQSYIRMLRISYEVIKHVQPDALVAIGGIGYQSFLDAVLRNTDNPDGGKVTTEYPETGGAWFDCLNYHLYPMYYMKEWSNDIKDFKYFRHTDAGVEITMDKKSVLEDVLTKYGYDGNKYPKKEVILTETNIPNKQVKDFIGSELAQRNFLMKLAVIGQKEGIKAIYPYRISDVSEQHENAGEYNYKGFYYPLPQTPTAAPVRMHESAIGWKTTSDILDKKDYNAVETRKLNLPDEIKGAAFGQAKDIVYALWAKTSEDMSETAKASFTFTGSTITQIKQTNWDGTTETINGNAVELTGEAAFYQVNGVVEEVILNVQSIALDSTARKVEEKETFNLKARLSPSNATDRTVTWESSDESIAIVDKYGEVKALKMGTVTITVKSVDGGKTASCKVTVTERLTSTPVNWMDLKPTYKDLPAGDTCQIKVFVYPETAIQKVIWKSSNESVAIVDSLGNVTAIANGKATITATSKVQSDKYKEAYIEVKGVPVNVAVSAISLSHQLNPGDSFTLVANIAPSNATNKTLTWESSNPSVATVDDNGKVLGVQAGNATISATSANGIKSASCDVIVNKKGDDVLISSIELDKDSETTFSGKVLQLTATILPANANQTLSWESSNTKVAIVDANGSVACIGAGEAIITARSIEQPNMEATCYIKVNTPVAINWMKLDPTYYTAFIGEAINIKASVYPEEGTDKELTWGSNASGVASVDANGLVTAHALGQATITARAVSDQNKVATATIVVKAATKSLKGAEGVTVRAEDKRLYITSEETITNIEVYSLIGGNLIYKGSPQSKTFTTPSLPTGIVAVRVSVGNDGLFSQKISIK